MGNDDTARALPAVHDPEGLHLRNCSPLYDDLVSADSSCSSVLLQLLRAAAAAPVGDCAASLVARAAVVAFSLRNAARTATTE